MCPMFSPTKDIYMISLHELAPNGELPKYHPPRNGWSELWYTRTTKLRRESVFNHKISWNLTNKILKMSNTKRRNTGCVVPFMKSGKEAQYSMMLKIRGCGTWQNWWLDGNTRGLVLFFRTLLHCEPLSGVWLC